MSAPDEHLFFSRDWCCRGMDSTYNIAVGRSADITGLYLDRDGRELTLDGGNEVLAGHGDMVAVGHQDVRGDYLVAHFYDATNGGMPTLAVRKLAWDADGWPIAWTAQEQRERG